MTNSQIFLICILKYFNYVIGEMRCIEMKMLSYHFYMTHLFFFYLFFFGTVQSLKCRYYIDENVQIKSQFHRNVDFPP